MEVSAGRSARPVPLGTDSDVEGLGSYRQRVLGSCATHSCFWDSTVMTTTTIPLEHDLEARVAAEPSAKRRCTPFILDAIP